MNKIIFTIVFLFTSLSLFAQSTRYDALDDVEEVWVYPMLEIKLDLIFSKNGMDHYLQAELGYSSTEHNSRNIEKLQRLYPSYKVQLYPIVLKHASIDFKDADPIPFDKWSNWEGGKKGWPISTELKRLPLESQDQVFEQINTQEVFNIRVKIIKEGREKEYSPNLEMNISIFNY